jgi:hypothetical protein
MNDKNFESKSNFKSGIEVDGLSILDNLKLLSGETIYNISSGFTDIDDNTIITSNAINTHLISNYYKNTEVYNSGETYTKTEVDDNFLALLGGTLTGDLTLDSSSINVGGYINIGSNDNTTPSEGDIWYFNSLYFRNGTTTTVDLLDKIPTLTGETGNLPMITANGTLEDSGIPAIQEDFDLIDFITIKDVDENSNFVIQAGFRIVSLVLEETSGNTAGDISIGTFSGGTDVISGETVGASSLVDTTILKPIFSTTESIILYYESTNWGSSKVNFHIRLEKFIEGE